MKLCLKRINYILGGIGLALLLGCETDSSNTTSTEFTTYEKNGVSDEVFARQLKAVRDAEQELAALGFEFVQPSENIYDLTEPQWVWDGSHYSTTLTGLAREMSTEVWHKRSLKALEKCEVALTQMQRLQHLTLSAKHLPLRLELQQKSALCAKTRKKLARLGPKTPPPRPSVSKVVE